MYEGISNSYIITIFMLEPNDTHHALISEKVKMENSALQMEFLF